MSTYRDIVVGAVESAVRGSAPQPSSAKALFDSFMNSYTPEKGFNNNQATGWLGTPDLPDHDRAMDEEVIADMNVNNNGVNFMSDVVKSFWEVIVKDLGGGDMYYSHEEHYQDHVALRIRETGYKLYEYVGGSGRAAVKRTIEGRDIMYMAAMLAAPELLKAMKNELLYKVFN